LEITWLGGDSLLLRGRETRVLIDPTNSGVEAGARAGIEIVVGGAGAENMLRPESGPQVVAHAGEYELRGVSLRGINLPAGPVFVTEVDEVSVCNFGELPLGASEEALESLGVIDVLAVSVGGGTPARAMEVAQLVARLMPAVVIPVGYEPQPEGVPGQLAAFAKEMGAVQVTPQPKLTLSGSAPGGSVEETRVVVLDLRR
jgi:L-ascorbate metabolism protein UlaG (beta-lactamase superfamily)